MTGQLLAPPSSRRAKQTGGRVQCGETSPPLSFAPTPCPRLWDNACLTWNHKARLCPCSTIYLFSLIVSFCPFYGLNISALFSSLQGGGKGIWSISNQVWKTQMLAEAKGNEPSRLGRDSDHGPIKGAAASLLRDYGPRAAPDLVFCIVTLVISLGIIRKNCLRLEKGQKRLLGILSVDCRVYSLSDSSGIIWFYRSLHHW